MLQSISAVTTDRFFNMSETISSTNGTLPKESSRPEGSFVHREVEIRVELEEENEQNKICDQPRAQISIPEGEKPFGAESPKFHSIRRSPTPEESVSRPWTLGLEINIQDDDDSSSKRSRTLLYEDGCIPEEDEDEYSGQYSTANEDLQVYINVGSEYEGSVASYVGIASVRSEERVIRPPRAQTSIVLVCTQTHQIPDEMNNQLPGENPVPRIEVPSFSVWNVFCCSKDNSASEESRGLAMGYFLYVVLLTILFFEAFLSPPN